VEEEEAGEEEGEVITEESSALRSSIVPINLLQTLKTIFHKQRQQF
jgi:hypothetical protein